MDFSIHQNMKHKRITTLSMRAHTFGEEQFLTALTNAFRSKYRIEINYIEEGSTEVQSMVIGSEDQDGYPHIDPEGEPA